MFEFAGRLGAEYPVFAFSHCRDVVGAVSRAGGVGVLGGAAFSPEEFKVELDWVERNVEGSSYGVNVTFPPAEVMSEEEMAAAIPRKHWDFVGELAERFAIPMEKAGKAGGVGEGYVISQVDARAQIAMALEKDHVGALVSALGPLPLDVMEEVRRARPDMLVGGMCGAARHAIRHKEQGADFVVAQGSEAAGHTGEIGTFVLVPEVVEAVDPMPVLAAGGIGSGRQMAAALALGASGVWTGSIWLASKESDVDPVVIDKLVRAEAKDAVRSRATTGKPARQLTTEWLRAWEEEGAPEPLPAPLQGRLVKESMDGIYGGGVERLMNVPVGQIVGAMAGVRSSRHILLDLVEGYVERVRELGGEIEEG